jgi:chitinase domain-containing protein 1
VIECGYPAFFQKLLMTLSSLLHQSDKELIVVLPSLLSEQYRQIMTAEVFSTLAQYVDKFSLMTYDYSSHDP